jgi:hypothetical protein
MPTYMWIIWAFVLIIQNWMFTFVSRARNSGSVGRHAVAALGSNGVWFISQIIVVSTFMSILSGKYGVRKAIAAGLFYTAFTVLGSLLAHWYALNTEKGKSAVGANKKYAQITVEEWSAVQRMLTEWTAREERLAQWLTHPASEAFDKAMADIREDIGSLEDEIDAPETEVVIPDLPVADVTAPVDNADAPPDTEAKTPSLDLWQVERLHVVTLGNTPASVLYEDYVTWWVYNSPDPRMSYSAWLK